MSASKDKIDGDTSAGRLNGALRSGDLGDYPFWLRTVSAWIHAEWNQKIGRTYAETVRQLKGRMGTQGLPTTIVAFHTSGEPVGTASIVRDICLESQEFLPFLCNVFVAPAYRRQGVGTWLCGEAASTASRLGERKLSLYTSDQIRFYRRVGWLPRLKIPASGAG